ncbi:hypothetical protein BpHYR1_052408 [Brachionus plicatilis]|uniref:Uncharacterized protein n=1 Tax=Brachionus plicatilis TaxID=10195 RepID=A0A3M7Q3D4_BRAPC|nr:hypothetical protein BpHYR1_052408 [Brachionus plicatilis]
MVDQSKKKNEINKSKNTIEKNYNLDRIYEKLSIRCQNTYFLVPGTMDETIYFIQKLNSNLIFIRNATYSNIDSNMHIRFHH